MSVPPVYSGFGQSVRDQLPFVDAVNNLIIEAERLRFYNARNEYIRAVDTIFKKVSSADILRKEAEQARAEVDRRFAGRIRLINRTYPNQRTRVYQSLHASEAKKRAAEKAAAELLRELQIILDRHDMLLRTSQGEEGSI